MKQHQQTHNKPQETTDEIKESSQSKTTTVCNCIKYIPLIRLIYQPVLVIDRVFVREIPYQPQSDSAHSKQKNDSGLDCSGQGECQPDIENSDGDRMQRYLVRANRQKKTCARRQPRAHRLNKEEKTPQLNNKKSRR